MRRFFWAIALITMVFVGTNAFAATKTILNLSPLGSGSLSPNFSWTGGAAGSASFTSPFLLGVAPGNILAPALTIPAGIGAGDGKLSATQIDNVSVVLTGLSVSGNATQSGSIVNQPLTGGTLRLVTSTGKILLTASVASAYLELNPLSGNFLNLGEVAFSASPIAANDFYPDMLAKKLNTPGGFSFGLTGFIPSTSPSISGGYLDAFTADATGLISASVVPLPAAAWGGLALLGAVGAYRVRRARKMA